jgi:hypothetical protein
MKYSVTRDKSQTILDSPKYGEKVYLSCLSGDFDLPASNWLISKPMSIESVLRQDMIVVYDRKPATLLVLLRVSTKEWLGVGGWELRKGTRKSILIRELEKKFSKRVPDIGDKCLVLVESHLFEAEVTKLDHKNAQFDVIFGESEMLNIPYSRFRPV